MQTPSPPPSSSRRGTLPNATSNRSRQAASQQQQLMQANMAPSRYAIDDIISSQGSLRRDVMRNDETVQLIRQENIMLAEKVQHATNLYRQLLGRVSQTEEKLDMEQKTMTNIMSSAKQVEVQLVNQQEGIVARESQMVLQVNKMQEEVSILKAEREQQRKNQHQMSQDIRHLQEKLARQSGTLSNGLQDLKSHLDQKDSEKAQVFNVNFNDLRERVESQEHSRSIFQTQMEGSLETLKTQINQFEKQRQEDVYNMSTLTREKEALARADVRRLTEKFREVFEEFNKNVSGKNGTLRTDLEGRVMELEKKFTTQRKTMQQNLKDLEVDGEDKFKELKESLRNEMDNFKGNIQKKEDGYNNIEVEKAVKQVEKQINQNKKDIEKVVRAEISSRLTQSEKFAEQLKQINKENNETIHSMHEALLDNKRKQEHALAETKVDLQRALQKLGNELRCDYSEHRTVEMEKKIEEIEDALDEFAKLDERIDMNSERIKQMEMENILAQGDMHNAIDANTKLIKQTSENYKDTLQELEQERKKPQRPTSGFVELQKLTHNIAKDSEIFPSKIKILEKKLGFLSEAFEEYKREHRGLGNGTFPQNKNGFKMENQFEKMREIIIVLRRVLTEKITNEHQKSRKDTLLSDLKQQLDDLGDLNNNDGADGTKDTADDESDVEDEDEEDEEEEEEDEEEEDEEEEEEEEEEDEEEEEEEDEEEDEDEGDEEEEEEEDGKGDVNDKKDKDKPKAKENKPGRKTSTSNDVLREDDATVGDVTPRQRQPTKKNDKSNRDKKK